MPASGFDWLPDAQTLNNRVQVMASKKRWKRGGVLDIILCKEDEKGEGEQMETFVHPILAMSIEMI